MASWKKILTTDDIDDISNSDLGSNNLTQSDGTRTYDIGSNDYLIFRGDSLAFGANQNMITLDTANHQVWLEGVGGVRVGRVAADQYYQLPQGNTCGNNKFLVGVDAAAAEFRTPSQLFNPDGSVFSGFMNWTDTDLETDAATDSVLVYDASTQKIKHVVLSVLPVRVMYHFGLNSSVGTGETFLKGVNGVQHSTSIGFVATRKLRLVGASFGWWKENTGSTHRKQLRIYRNGTLVCTTTAFGGGASVLSFVTQYENDQTDTGVGSPQDFSGAIVFEAGDVISTSSYTANAYSGSGNSLQATLEFV
jgi:hypothetical protein